MKIIYILVIGLFFCFPVFASEVPAEQSALEVLLSLWGSSDWWIRLILLIPVIHPLLLTFFAWTDTPRDDILYGKVYKFLEKLVGITNKTKQVAPNKNIGEDERWKRS